MNNSQVPPPPPVAAASQQGQQGAAPVARQPLRDVPVTQVPAALQRSGQSIQIPGRVVSSLPVTGNAVAREIRISTSNGDIVVQANANLAENTEVTVNIYVQKGALLATLTLPRGAAGAAGQTTAGQAAAPETGQSQARAPAQPPPPLQAGDSFQAIYLPEPSAAETSVPALALPDPALAQALMQIADIIDEIHVTGLQALPRPLPLPPQLMAEIALAPDVLGALQQLPAADQQQLAAYVQRPDVQEALDKLSAQARDAPVDDNMLQIIRSQAGARMTQDMQPPAAQERPAQPAFALLKGLLPLLETLQNPETPLGGSAQTALQPNMPARGAAFAGETPQGLVQVKIISISPPGGQGAVTETEISASSPAGGQVLQGVVESVSPSGYPVVRVGNDLYVLKTQNTAPPGSTITFQAGALKPGDFLQSHGQAAGAGGAGALDNFDPRSSTGWPSLQEALNSISPSMPGLAEALRATIPTATERLAPTVLFFLSSLRSGDIENWLGEPLLQALRQGGKGALADRLAADFGKISTDAKTPTPDGWRVTSLPLLHEGEISQLQFFVRQQQDDKDEKQAEGPAQPMTRFILNLSLSRLGDMQLDGLLHKKRFDMILRSEATVAPSMRRDLLQSFSGALGQVKMQGGLTFQTKAEQWVRIESPRRGTTA